MGFFDGAEEDPSGDSAADLELPAFAERRLADLGASALFTSTLSVNEFALLSELGPQPVAAVQGTSVYQVGWQYLSPDARSADDLFVQLDVISRAWDQARRNAFDRLAEEASLVGADLVLGVRLRRGTHRWAKRSVEFIVSGTAVRAAPLRPGTAAPPAPAPAAPPPQAPLLSDLSVQDYWRLRQGGWSPAGLLAATAAFFISQGTWTTWQRRRSVMQSQERWEYSDGFSAARHSVVNDIRRQARSTGADGVVGMALEYEIDTGSFDVQSTGSGGSGLSIGSIVATQGDLPTIGGRDKRKGVVVTFHAVGTAIRRDVAPARSLNLHPQLSLGASA